MFVFKLVFLQRFLITATDLIVILYTVCFNTFTQRTVSLFVYSSFHKTKAVYHFKAQSTNAGYVNCSVTKCEDVDNKTQVRVKLEINCY